MEFEKEEILVRVENLISEIREQSF